MKQVCLASARSRVFNTPKHSICLHHGFGTFQTRDSSRRSLSTGTERKNALAAEQPYEAPSTQRKVVDSPMSRLPTTNLLRSIILGYCFNSPRILSLSLKMMNVIVSSKSPLLNPDKNALLGRILRTFVYDQFCAGTTPAEVQKTVAQIKGIGYSGVILGYGREIVLSGDATKEHVHDGQVIANDPHIEAWLQGNIDTLKLIGAGDFMNIKFTGAGKAVSEALIEGKAPPPQMAQAMNAIVEKAISQNSRVWVDAEQQIFHPTIDNWAIDLMRRYNRNGQAPVLNTVQAYLKASRQNVLHHLNAAQSEGWTLGIKLVRGAYIQQDVRNRIWETKEETDDSYNSIAHDLLSKDFDTFTGANFPDVHVFLAGHNKESIRLASTHIQDLARTGATLNPVGFGQLHGMADEVGCELIQQYQKPQEEAAAAAAGVASVDAAQLMQGAPRVYKCLNWGSVRDCMHFLMRRAVENASATERLKDGMGAAKAELRRRFFG